MLYWFQVRSCLVTKRGTVRHSTHKSTFNQCQMGTDEIQFSGPTITRLEDIQEATFLREAWCRLGSSDSALHSTKICLRMPTDTDTGPDPLPGSTYLPPNTRFLSHFIALYETSEYPVCVGATKMRCRQLAGSTRGASEA